VGGGLLTVLTGFGLFAYYNFTHNFLKFSPQQIADMQTALKGAMGEAIFSGQQPKAEVVPAEQLKGKNGLDALFASTPTSNKGEGLIMAYQKDPQKFKRYADMLDTAMNAKKVGDAVLREGGLHPPRTSEPLAMEPNLKVDAWGNPFCIIPIREKLAVVSGGPSRLPCEALPLTPEQIAKSTRSLYAGPSDVVVVVTLRPQQPAD